MSIALISHPDCYLHEMGASHPESPQRLIAISDQLKKTGLWAQLHHYDAPLVSKASLYATHDSAYVDQLFQLAPKAEQYVELDPDTVMNIHTLNAALRASGASVLAVDLVMAGTHSVAFCNVRPPGHHAEYSRAMGFCFFNNVAVAVRHALEQWHLQRIAIVDFDVHHGNGTEDIFFDESRVLLCSTFQHPLYPYKGAATHNEHIVNIPLAAGTTGKQYRAVVEEKLLPKLRAFQPQLIFFSAGFDAHADDPLASLNLAEEDYAWLTSNVKEIADRTAEGRMISCLEGGYHLKSLAASAEAHIRALM